MFFNQEKVHNLVTKAKLAFIVFSMEYPQLLNQEKVHHLIINVQTWVAIVFAIEYTVWKKLQPDPYPLFKVNKTSVL